jgi:phosphopantothenoylcysteine synthetase/decarboxylase
LTSRSTTSSMTPLLLSQSMAALAQHNAATRRSIPALQQRSAMDVVQRTKGVQATAAEQHHQPQPQHSTRDTKALQEYGSESGLGNGHHDDGVGR